MLVKRTLKHFHMCCGLGGGAKGFNRAKPVVGNMQAEWLCVGGVDVDPAGLRDFQRLAGIPGTLMDLFTREQYTAFHGVEPPAGWREATAEDVRRAANNQDPDAVFISSPCKGASGLLSETMSLTPKYQALNELTLRCVWLMCEAWKHNPVSLIVFENVPRLATRGRHLLDQIGKLLEFYGYGVAETTHDCGVIGGLAQSRKRFLLVARHIEKVPPFLYEPEKKTLKSVGSILGRMPMAGDVEAAGPMHRVPALQWKTWVRLALVEAGKDWRCLNDLAIEDGYLRDLIIVPQFRDGFLGVHDWNETAGTVAARSGPTNGKFSVADPRARAGALQYQQYGVRRWDETSGAVIGVKSPGQGTFSVADPRDPGIGHAKYNVAQWDGVSRTVISGSTTGQGAFAIQDPRPGMAKEKGDAYLTGGHYGVVGFDQPAGAVSASACHDNGRWSVADPRMPAAADRLTCIITSLDGTWHRPFTTLELAALQSLVDPEEQLELDGLSDQSWRERIGNAVPPAAAEAIAHVMGTTLLLAAAGETFMLNSMPIWVRPVAVGLSVAQQGVTDV
ncbi:MULTISPECIES: DNA cytosine methyltransferase [unclassified Pseudomonas]|uniref:DNA cytosine methyltransferase n=1 Tax=unclassified Pseudomonas TaxID=196821 RepID=UPI00035736FA|nr:MULTISPECIES: DNA cytosine methyltransferase [unclassified Pseudomonas]OKP74017.1 DNA cytosine methyltransferase [Pseudomonas fluorescens]EPJ83211.1 C-5 cytosine-specific DNA methylase [Pseudomonas sp. CFT9]PMX16171.1 DNA cytosine methyltransferase [Pseudomonas sp. MPBC4-3]PMX49044.1 DNA cytosine methyltransferase [Pseudomonas sp. FW301-21B01]PMY08037.1 DNA cytosine methyltransferase [Pseudomonas sp. MPR-R5A]